MSNKRPSLEIFQTPIGVLSYPWLQTPDTRYNATGTFQTKIRIPFDQAQDLIAQMERIRDAEYAKLDPQKASTYVKKDVYEVVFTSPEPDATEEEKAAFVSEPTDIVEFKAKLNALVTPKEGDPFTQRMIVIDADEVPVTLPVWSGSKAMLRGHVISWTNAAQKQVGVQLRMKACKVFELVTGEGSTWGKFE